MTNYRKLSNKQKIYMPFKRLLDIFFSLVLLLILSPLFVFLGLIVCIDTKGFPIFRQKRIGKNNKEFLILKFRSMNKKAPKDIPTRLLDNPNQYITRFGRFIRRSSLDELPQLVNILIGQMSFVGPRPVVWAETDVINARTENWIQIIKPGLTGWAQVHGRDKNNLLRKIELDSYYLKNFNFCLDMKIVFATIGKVISQKDVIDGKQS